MLIAGGKGQDLLNSFILRDGFRVWLGGKMQEMPIIFRSFRRCPDAKSVTPEGLGCMSRLIESNARQG